MAKGKSKFVRRLPLVGIFLILATGVCFFMYPILGNWFTEQSAQSTIKHYDETVQQLGDEAIEQLIKKAEEYNEALAKNQGSKISALNYDELLAVTEAIGYIEVPKIGAYYPIYHGLSNDVLQKGIGHMEGTSLPLGGPNTHCVLAGHTGLPGSKLFTDLDTMTEGDIFYVHVLDRVLRYRVDQIKVVLPNATDDILIEKDKDYVTLVTCTPYGINDHRLLVRGTRAPYQQLLNSQDEEDEDSNAESDDGQQSSYGGVNIREDSSQNKTERWQHTVTDEPTPQVVPARTVIWYIAAGTVSFVLLGIILILVFPTFRRRKKNKAKQSESDKDCDNKANTD